MLHTTLGQFIIMTSAIIGGTLLLAAFWAAMEKAFPPLNGYFARR